MNNKIVVEYLVLFNIGLLAGFIIKNTGLPFWTMFIAVIPIVLITNKIMTGKWL